MKKIVLTVLGLMFITSSAFAASMGISGTAMYYDASGTETTKSSAQKNEGNEDGVAVIPSFFIEKDSANGIMGVEIVPYGAKVADFDNARTDTDTDDASDTAGNNKGDVNFKNHITLYMERPVDGPIDGSFVKYGISTVSIETDETTATGSTYGDVTMDGQVIGFGFNNSFGDGLFMRAEANYMTFGSEKVSSGDNTITMTNLDGVTGSIKIGKSF